MLLLIVSFIREENKLLFDKIVKKLIKSRASGIIVCVFSWAVH